MSKIVCFGEVLWDVFSNGNKKIGGAPLNVALRLHAFNNEVTMISAIGNDQNGIELLDYLIENNLSIEGVQKKVGVSTGEVQVTLNNKGSATYRISHPSAWDKIELTNTIVEKVKNSDALVFGSLITRDEVSRYTLFELIDLSKYKIFDLNLRPPHYSKDILMALMEKADFIKFNDDELYEVSKYFGSKYNGLEQNLKFIAEQTHTKHVCVTKGEHGAVLLYNDNLYYNSGYKVSVVDTVGAGDSFLGSLISELIHKTNPQQALDFACAVGALVAQKEGATPKISLDEIGVFINP